MKSIRNTALTVLGALTLGLTSQSAMAEVSNKSALVTDFSSAQLTTVLSEMGAAYQKIQQEGKADWILAEVPLSGRSTKVMFIPHACLGAGGTSGCVGLQSIIINDQISLSMNTHEVNMNNPFSTLGNIQNGFYIQRYEIADYGIAKGNVESSISNLIYGYNLVIGALTSNQVSVDYTPDTEQSDFDALHAGNLDMTAEEILVEVAFIEKLIQADTSDSKISNEVAN